MLLGAVGLTVAAAGGKILKRLRQERYLRHIDEQLGGGRATLEIVASPLHTAQLFAAPAQDKPTEQPSAYGVAPATPTITSTTLPTLAI